MRRLGGWQGSAVTSALSAGASVPVPAPVVTAEPEPVAPAAMPEPLPVRPDAPDVPFDLRQRFGCDNHNGGHPGLAEAIGASGRCREAETVAHRDLVCLIRRMG